MKIYIICPVRNITQQQKREQLQHVYKLEKVGAEVFYPPRDVQQQSQTGWQIVSEQIKQIKDCDWVYVFWDVTSKGSHFDLGVAMAYNKPIVVISEYQYDKKGKSYIKVIDKYMQNYDCKLV